jgi:preprotein translocase subunit YajC
MIFALMHPYVLAQATGGDQGIAPTLIMFGLLFGIMYFLIWRPQKQKEEERKELLKRIKKNDHVVTTGGIIGIVTSVKDDEVTLKVDDAQNVRIRFTRGSIAGIVGEAETGAAASEEKSK